MRISDWSSDVCSSDLNDVYAALAAQARRQIEARKLTLEGVAPASGIARPRLDDILDGRARDVSLRELAGLALALGLPLPQTLAPLESGVAGGPLPVKKLIYGLIGSCSGRARGCPDGEVQV